MNESTCLVLLSRADLALIEADTVFKLKDLKNMALTAADWLKRQKASKDVIQKATSIAFESERKMGQLLLDTERAKGTRCVGGDKRSGGTVILPPEQAPTLAEIGLTKRDSSQAQKLAKLPEEVFEAVKRGERTRSGAHVSNNGGENEWYTPAAYIAAAVSVMGGIDCDPASSKVANKIIKAAVFFTQENDGLCQKWSGRVWLNPPYAQPLIGKFAEAVSAKFEFGEIKQACVLVNNATETAWFQRMLGVCSAVCFPVSRIRFLDPQGHPGAPLQGQAVLYLGKRIGAFVDAFKEFGTVLLHE